MLIVRITDNQGNTLFRVRPQGGEANKNRNEYSAVFEHVPKSS
jgi:hypothetical protein